MYSRLFHIYCMHVAIATMRLFARFEVSPLYLKNLEDDSHGMSLTVLPHSTIQECAVVPKQTKRRLAPMTMTKRAARMIGFRKA
jgi:hypothetical protein